MSDLWRHSVVVAAFVSAVVAALVNGAFALLRGWWLERRLASDKAAVDERLERLRGTIRADVERDLRYRESRARVAAEIELRMHDREWLIVDQVSETFAGTVTAFERTLIQLMVIDARGGSLYADLANAKVDLTRFIELRALLPKVPGDTYANWLSAAEKLEEVRSRISSQIEAHRKGARRTLTGPWCDEAIALVRQAATESVALQRQWREQLRTESIRILGGLKGGDA